MENRMEEDLERIDAELSEMAERARHLIEDFVVEQPHAALALAAATGFVLGGGLTPRRIMRLGLIVAGPMLTRLAVTEGTRVLRDMLEGAPIEEARVQTVQG